MNSRTALNLTKIDAFRQCTGRGADAGPAGRPDARPYERGYEVTLEVPIFDSGAASRRKSQASMPKRSTALRRPPSMRARRFGGPTPPIARPLTSRDSSAMRCCRAQIDRRSRTCCATTLRSSASSICWPMHARKSRASMTTSRALRDFWMAKSELDASNSSATLYSNRKEPPCLPVEDSSAAPALRWRRRQSARARSPRFRKLFPPTRPACRFPRRRPTAVLTVRSPP